MQVSTQMGPFSIVPEWVLNKPLSPTALKLYCVLARYADYETGIAFPSRDTLAERMSCSGKTIDRAVTELVAMGCVLKFSRGRYQSAQYKVLQIDPNGTDLSEFETDLSSEGTDLSEREDKNDTITITNKQEPLERKPIIRAKPKSADDYEPTETLLEELATAFPQVRIDVELQKFRDHHMAKGSRFSLWDRAFRKWITQASEWNRPGAARPERLTNNQKAALLAHKYRQEAKQQEIETMGNPQQAKQIEAELSTWFKGVDDV